MKANVHPQYFTDATITCFCGNSFVTGSTKPSIRVSVCDKCHPFYTGEQKFIDTKGKVDKFSQSMKVSAAYKAKIAEKKQSKGKKTQEVKSLRDLLAGS